MFLNQTTATTWPWQPPISLSERATLIPQRRARILSKKWRVKEVPENSHERNEGGIKKMPPPPTQNLVCCLWHKDSGQPQIICHSLIYKLPSGISSHFLPIAKSRYCISQTHIGRDSCITSLGMWIVGVTLRIRWPDVYDASKGCFSWSRARTKSTISQGSGAPSMGFLRNISRLWNWFGLQMVFSSGITRLQLQRTRLMKRWIKRNTKRSWRNTWRNTPSATFLSLRENPFR